MEPNLIFQPSPKVFALTECVKIKIKGFKNGENQVQTTT
jgi:hypothetical protein